MQSLLNFIARCRTGLGSIRALLVLLICAGTLNAAADPRASVDRNQVALGDSLTLTIQSDETGGPAPDYAVLQTDFEVYGSSQSTRRSLINGRLQSSVEWQVTLVPKRTGTLTIPPLAAAGGTTQPLAVRVAPASAPTAADANEPVFMEAQLDRESAYVQQQVVLTIRIFRAIQLDNMDLSEPAFDTASVRKLSETSFQREIHDTPYVVHEIKYAIFPQQPGSLTIPELVFNAVQPLTRRTLFDFPGQGRRLRKMTQQLNLTVKPIPKNFTGTVWLPAQKLTLSQRWSDSAQTLKIGDSVTRNITVEADGVLAAQLPALELPQPDNAKVYADQPTLDDQQGAGGIHGKRTDNIAVLPNRAGELHLPEVRVTWWDVDSDSEKVTTLPPATLHIVGSAQPAAAGVPPAANATAPTSAIDTTGQAQPLAANRGNLVWQAATLVLALAWLTTLYFNWRLRRRPAAAPVTDASADTGTSERAAFERLKEACRTNDPAPARAALTQWARLFYRASSAQTLEQLVPHSGSAALLREVQLLDNRLFGTHPESNAWNGENLLSVVRDLRGTKTREGHAAAGLAPLYPT